MRLKPSRAAVVGHPIAHSKSPALHAAAYRLLEVELSYDAIDVLPSDLAAFVQRLRAETNWVGLSVTMPHKAAMLDLVDAVDDDVRALGVLNTVVVDAVDGRLLGRNTDVLGIVNAMTHAGLAQVQHGTVLGAGGTALAALTALARLGASAATVVLRDAGKSTELEALARTLAIELQVVEFSQLQGAPFASGTDVLLSTLPPRAADAQIPVFQDLLIAVAAGGSNGAPGFLLDVAYDPWPSALATAAEAAGVVVVSGLEMLMYQAVAQVAAFTGIELAGRTDVINVMCDSIGLPRR